jgi:hypothetical protein
VFAAKKKANFGVLHQSCVRKEAKFDFLNRQRGCEAGSGLWAVRGLKNEDLEA